MLKEIILWPGLVFHEVSHFIMCLFLGVKVKKIHFNLREGSVTHIVPRSIMKSLLVAIAPTILAIVFTYYAMQYNFSLLTFYLSFVFIYQSVPSKEDTNFFIHHKKLKQVIMFPIFIIIRLFYYINTKKNVPETYTLFIILLMLNI